jgi:hypothetical protein
MAREFKNVDQAERVIGDVEDWIGVTGDDGRLRTGVANQIDPFRQACEILGVSDVHMYEINSAPAKMRQIQLASAAHQIVSYDHAIAATLKMKGKLSAYESAPAGN